MPLAGTGHSTAAARAGRRCRACHRCAAWTTACVCPRVCSSSGSATDSIRAAGTRYEHSHVRICTPKTAENRDRASRHTRHISAATTCSASGTASWFQGLARGADGPPRSPERIMPPIPARGTCSRGGGGGGAAASRSARAAASAASRSCILRSSSARRAAARALRSASASSSARRRRSLAASTDSFMYSLCFASSSCSCCVCVCV